MDRLLGHEPHKDEGAPPPVLNPLTPADPHEFEARQRMQGAQLKHERAMRRLNRTIDELHNADVAIGREYERADHERRGGA